MKFWTSHRGTVSVFLALVLLPVVVFGGLVTDAVRVYHSKGLISEAGELAMNAGLSYYDTELKDEYGLLAMTKKPEEMDLEQYFVNTIRASGLEGAGDVRNLLDLKLDGSFTALGVDGSQIYQTEVEKQQILEYMKYRAPVCIGEELLDKLKQVKDNKKKAAAIEKQIKFAESMDELQDACEKAKEALEEYLKFAEEAPAVTKEAVNASISAAEENLKQAVIYLLMLYVCENYSEQDEAENFMDSMADFNDIIGSVPAPSADNLESIFASYVFAVFYYNNIPEGLALPAAVLAAKTGLSASEAAAVDAVYAEYQSLVGRLAVYTANLKAAAEEKMDTARYDIKQTWKIKVEKALASTGTCVDKLNQVENALREAKTAHGEWTEKINALSDGGDMKKNMEEEAGQYADLLNQDALQNLKKKLNENKDALTQILAKLQNIKFCGSSLTGDINQNSVKDRIAQTGRTVDVSAHYAGIVLSDMGGKGREFMSANFEKQEITETLHKIKEDPFYKKLAELCEGDAAKKDSQEEKKGKDTTNTLLGKLKSAFTGDGISGLEDKAEWDSVMLPSAMLAQAESAEADALDEDTGGADSRSERKKTMDNARNSLDSMGNWLDSMEHILNGAIENIYIMEYGIQMFSYYTVNKEAQPDGTVTDLTEVKSLSGDDLTDNAMYRSEVEYMLWGKKNVQENVKNTRLMLYGIRMVFNLIYAFTDKEINTVSTAMAEFMSCGVQFLVPVFQTVIRVGVAAGETACDVTDLMAGRNVPVIKDKNTRQIDLADNGQETASGSSGGLTLNYKEYLTIFLLIKTIGPLEKTTLARIADCIQLNVNLDLTSAYTMLAVQAKVKSRTTFMKKAAELPDSGIAAAPDDWFTISYKSVLGY